MSVRKTQQVETRLLAEYLSVTYPQYPVRMMQPLGRVDEQLQREVGVAKAAGLSRPVRYEVDAVVVMPGALVLVEAKVWHLLDGLAKLPLYASLVPYTPELKDYQHLPLVLELVLPWSNPNLLIMARAYNVRVVEYRPPWISEVVNKIQDYSTYAYRQAREEKMRLRTLLGVE